MLVSAVSQSESAIRIHISPYPLPLEPPSHPPYPTPLDHHKYLADLSVLCGCFPLASYFTFGSVYMSVPLSHFVPACPSPTGSSSPFFTSESYFPEAASLPSCRVRSQQQIRTGSRCPCQDANPESWESARIAITSLYPGFYLTPSPVCSGFVPRHDILCYVGACEQGSVALSGAGSPSLTCCAELCEALGLAWSRIGTLWPFGQIQPVFGNKVLLESSHTHLFTCYLCCFWTQWKN